jgi:hypothetical protein
LHDSIRQKPKSKTHIQVLLWLISPKLIAKFKMNQTTERLTILPEKDNIHLEDGFCIPINTYIDVK